MKRDSESADDRTVPRTHRFSELFASMVNHEMRNALNVVSTAANLLEMRAESEKIATPVKRISLSALRMERMLSQLVDFTRIELDGALVLIREPVELDELMQDLLSEIPEPQRKRVVIAEANDVQGSWDRDRVKQALTTLVVNALQHGVADAQVNVSVSLDANLGATREVGIDVESQGQIAPDVLETLFVPKRRSPQPAAASGLGLGLYVAQHVAAAHGGVLEVSSAKGRTRFTLRLPAQPAHVATAAKVTVKHA
jgi:signal transduction histidine kinase